MTASVTQATASAWNCRAGGLASKLPAVVSYMEEGLEEPYSQTELARKANLSTRQWNGYSANSTSTPTRYYLNLRLARARFRCAKPPCLSCQSPLPADLHCVSLSKCYREIYGRTPRAERAPDAKQLGLRLCQPVFFSPYGSGPRL